MCCVRQFAPIPFECHLDRVREALSALVRFALKPVPQRLRKPDRDAAGLFTNLRCSVRLQGAEGLRWPTAGRPAQRQVIAPRFSPSARKKRACMFRNRNPATFAWAQSIAGSRPSDICVASLHPGATCRIGGRACFHRALRDSALAPRGDLPPKMRWRILRPVLGGGSEPFSAYWYAMASTVSLNVASFLSNVRSIFRNAPFRFFAMMRIAFPSTAAISSGFPPR